MADKVFPTKSSLIATKRSLALSLMGYELLDKKRSVLVMEMMRLIDRARDIQSRIDGAYAKAYESLRQANMATATFANIAAVVPVDNGIQVRSRSVMGVELPIIHAEAKPPRLVFGFLSTNSKLDEAYIEFGNLKKMIIELAEVENSVYRLATAIKKTKIRANSLQNIIIPQLTQTVKTISESLEEKEREEFSRLKVIKRRKEQ